jgi:hypothetical protein
MSADRIPTSRGISPLADIRDGEGHGGEPEPVIRGEHPLIPVPVLPRRRHEIGQPVQEVKKREFDDAVGARPRGLAPAPRARAISEAPAIRVLSGVNPASLPSSSTAAWPSRSMPNPSEIIARLVRIQASSVRSAALRFRSRASSLGSDAAPDWDVSAGASVAGVMPKDTAGGPW